MVISWKGNQFEC